LFRVSTENAGSLIGASIENDVPDALVGDPFRLNQVISNLIGNAVKFTKNGRIDISIKTVTGESIDGVMLEFVVKDTGIGIPADKMTMLFDGFSQVDSSNTRLHGGSGLGLSICKGLVEKMGGEIWVESIVGEGSSFSFTCVLERAVGSTDSMELATVSQPKEKREISFLIVDDDAVSRTLMEKVATSKGWKATLAESGKQAYEIVKQTRFDIILMDVHMPAMNGYETTAVIRGLERSKGTHTPIIALTAFALQGDKEKCLEAGMDDYLSKPVDVNAFYVAVEKWTK
jgi:CheY-like chemotaxis protein